MTRESVNDNRESVNDNKERRYKERRYNKFNNTNFTPSLTALRSRYTAAFEKFC